jgi:5'-3' exonuclease
MSEHAMVVDGNNILIRAHSGMSQSNLTTSDGRPSGGLYGTIRMFHMYLAKLKPTHVLWCWDQGKSTFRTSINSSYKGNRPTKSNPGEDENYDDLIATFKNFQDYLDLLHVAQIRRPGVEADDWIAQFVVEHRGRVPITILSADHDVRQLVTQPTEGEHPVEVLKPSVSNSNSVRRAFKEKLYTYEAVLEEYGLVPERLPELWAIQGDQSDNLPGARGMGPVRSLEALGKYGSLDAVIAHHPKLAGYEKIVSDNHRMIRLPYEGMESLPFPLSYCQWGEYYDEASVKAFFEHWEMASFLFKMTTPNGLFGEETKGMKLGFENIV